MATIEAVRVEAAEREASLLRAIGEMLGQNVKTASGPAVAAPRRQESAADTLSRGGDHRGRRWGAGGATREFVEARALGSRAQAWDLAWRDGATRRPDSGRGEGGRETVGRPAGTRAQTARGRSVRAPRRFDSLMMAPTSALAATPLLPPPFLALPPSLASVPVFILPVAFPANDALSRPRCRRHSRARMGAAAPGQPPAGGGGGVPPRSSPPFDPDSEDTGSFEA